MKRSLQLGVVWILCLIFSGVALGSDAPADPKKHTSLGKYVTAAEAYEMWKADQQKVKVLDVRTSEEYDFVGHAPMAVNIPSMLWSGKWNAEKKAFDLVGNPDFEAQVKARFKSDEPILVMCRSGHRSAAAVERLAKAGFTNVFNIVDGFEGDKVTDEDSYFKGKRLKNGWKNSPAPWTTALNPELVFISAK